MHLESEDREGGLGGRCGQVEVVGGFVEAVPASHVVPLPLHDLRPRHYSQEMITEHVQTICCWLGRGGGKARL